MELKAIYQPIMEDLNKVDIELKNQFNLIGKNHKFLGGIMDYLSDAPGKRLRPALALLSYKCVSGNRKSIKDNLVYFAAAVELIHTASLVHDDIVDKDDERRGKASLNKKYGTHIAILAGDLLYIRAFSILADKLDKNMLSIITKCVERMCYGEITELGRNISSFEDYLKVIEHKTAFFTSICCQVGAMLSNAEEKEVLNLKQFGLNFGMAYQLRDDYIDKDSSFLSKINSLEIVKKYILKAKENIGFLKITEYSKSLNGFTNICLENLAAAG